MTAPATVSVGAVAPPAAPIRTGIVVALVSAHIPIGLAMQASPALASAQAYLTILVVIAILFGASTPAPVVAAAAYVGGAEVLWRQTSAAVPWEVSKYLLIAVFAAGVIRFLGRPQRAVAVGLFLAALAPAAVIPVVRDGLTGAIDPLAFNLAGLVGLAVGVLLLGRLAGTWESLSPVPWMLVAPVTATAAISAASLRGLGPSDFFNDSNFRAAGGFGPNQVSAILGLGVVLLVLVAARESRRSLQLLAVTLAVWFLVQALLTFSRGGVLNIVVALLVALPFLVARRETGPRAALLVVVAMVSLALLLPSLESLTGDKLGQRFTDTRQADKRSELIAADFHTFTEHSLLGVGVGEAEHHRGDRLVIASHTEYTRLLAEHGMLGIVALACLGAMVVAAFRRQRTAFGLAWTAALVAWSLTELWHASTRLAATPFAFALGSFTIVAVAAADRDGPRHHTATEP